MLGAEDTTRILLPGAGAAQTSQVQDAASIASQTASSKAVLALRHDVEPQGTEKTPPPAAHSDPVPPTQRTPGTEPFNGGRIRAT